jgi:thiamine phosphate synthase YjbQ (UPF0047 family)
MFFTRGRNAAACWKSDVRPWVSERQISSGMLTLFCRHTSASLLIQKNAAPGGAQRSEKIPMMGGKLMLGTWQGIYLFEHRDQPSAREIVLHLAGEYSCRHTCRCSPDVADR